MHSDRDEYILDTLNDVFSHASNEALICTIQAIASQMGITDIRGESIQQFYERTKRSIAEENIANLADIDMKLASEITTFMQTGGLPRGASGEL